MLKKSRMLKAMSMQYWIVSPRHQLLWLHPVQWDHDEVDLVFMIGVPLSSRNKEHLRILAMLSRHLMKEAFRKELRKIRTDQEFYECIKFLEHEN